MKAFYCTNEASSFIAHNSLLTLPTKQHKHDLIGPIVGLFGK